MKKKEAEGGLGYVMIFLAAMIMVILTLYLLQMAKLMTHQHDVDDALADSVLASLIADDEYYYETADAGNAVVRFDDTYNSYNIYKECMNAAIGNTEGFYYNFRFDTFICYEVNGSTVTVTKYLGEYGSGQVTTGNLGTVKTPDGKVVSETSAYGKVRFDIKNILSGDYIEKTRSIYCTIKIN